MLWPKKHSYKEFDQRKKFQRLENSPPPITFLVFRSLGWCSIMQVKICTTVSFYCVNFIRLLCMLINSNTGVNVTHPSSCFNISGIFALTVSWVIRELKQRRLWRLRKRFLKIEVAYSMAFNLSNVGNFLWRWILNNCIEVQEKKKKVVSCLPVLRKTWN